MFPSLRQVNGFTLIETLFTMGIAAILFLGVGSLFTDVFRYNDIQADRLDAAQETRRVVRAITDELRTSSPSSLGAYAIEAAGQTQIIFYANIDADGLKERVRYFIQNGDLRRGVIKPTGQPLTYPAGNEAISTVAKGIANADVFTYYDQSYDGTSQPLSFPVNVSDVRLIALRLLIDADPSRPPGAYEIKTYIQIRNLKEI